MTIERLGQLTGELQTLADVQLYGGGAAPPVISSAKARTGSYSYRSAGAVPPFGMAFTPVAAVRCGVFLNHNGRSSGSPALVSLAVGVAPVYVGWNPAANEFSLVLGYEENSNSLRVAATAPAGAFSATDTWRHVAVTFLCAASGFFTLYVDGAAVLSFAGDTTVYRSLATVKEPAAVGGCFVLGAQGLNTWNTYAYADDFYCDAMVGEGDSAPSAKRFLFGGVNGAGASPAQWSAVGAASTSEAVDEAPPDGDATYAKALTAGLRDLYAVGDVTLPADHGVRAVIAVAVARKTDAGIGSTLKLGLSAGGVRTGAAQALPTAYGVQWARFAAQADGSAWSESAVNGQEVVIESAGSF